MKHTPSETHHSPRTPAIVRAGLAQRTTDQLRSDLAESVRQLAACPVEDTAAHIAASQWVWAELADRLGAEEADRVEAATWAELEAALDD